jgi:hypothetical protein
MEEAAIVTASVNRRTVEAGRGVAWWSESWALFMKNPVMWVIFGVIFVVGLMVLGFIPVLGGLAAALLSQVVIGGWLLAVRKQEGGATVEVGDLFLGFKEKLNPLVILGALALAAGVVVAIVMFIMGAGAVFGGAAAGGAKGVMAGAAVGLLTFVVCLVLAFVIGMAFWFAPALVVFGNVAPVEALKAAWSASWANVAALVVYGLIWIVAAIVASIPFGLGWFVLMPLTVLGLYASYKDIFEAP